MHLYQATVDRGGEFDKVTKGLPMEKNGVHSQKDRPSGETGYDSAEEGDEAGRGVFDRIIGFFAVIAGVLLIIMTLVVCYNVLMRYFIGDPPVWATEITEYIMLYATFLAAAWVLKEKGHVRIDILVGQLSSRGQYILNTIACLLGITACSILLYHSARATYSLYVREVISLKILPFPKYILIGVIPFGMLLTLIQFIRMALLLLEKKSKASIW